MSKALQFIHAVARKFLAKEGEGITSIANRMRAEAKASEIATTFQESGLPLSRLDEFIKSENDVVKYLNIIESKKSEATSNNMMDIVRRGVDKFKTKKSADVLDLKGNRIKNTDNIMGGEEIKIKDPALYEDRGGNIIPTQFSEAPAFPSYTAKETEEQILKRLKKQNEDSINRLKNKKDPEDPQKFYQGGQAQIEPDLSDVGHGSDALMARNMQLSPGSQATTSTGLNYLLGEDNDTTRVPYKNAGPVILPKPKPKPKADPMVELQRIYDLYQEVAPGVAQETQKYLQQDFINKLNEANISQEQFMTNQMQNNFAEGGPARQNFAMGKRAFLKMLGGVGAGIAGIKTGLLGLGKSGGKKVATEVAKEAATSGAPPHFLKLVAKIKALGDDVTETAALADRQTVKRYKDFELTEDIATGRIEIQRVKVADDMDYYGSPITEESYMGYSPGEEIFQETAKGKTKITKAQPKYEEGTTYLRNDGPETGSVLDEMSGLSDDIYEEAGEAVPEAIRKGKADGGRMGYAGGKKVVQGLAALIKGKFGKKAITTADKLKTPQKTLDRDMFSKFKDRNPDPKREITDDEFQDLMEDVGDLDAYNFDGTIGSANKIRKEAKDYQDYMYKQYKMGKLDPVAGDKSPGRKRFLEQKLDDMEGSGDKRLMSPDEIEELSSFDLGTQMDQMKKKTLPEIDDKLLKNYNDEIKRGVAEIMGDTSPEALKKSIEIDNLMLKYPGMDKNLADQIASSSPRMKADMIAMVEQTFKMSEKGMSGDDIIQTFKNTTRRKQATGGLASMLGE